MLKYRADTSELQKDGATVWRSRWLGGLFLSRVNDCIWESLHGTPRVTAYAMGEPDTFFSIPAKAWFKGKRVNGYLTSDDNGNIVFRHTYY